MNEDGANFSVGQRQLICVARAMLRKARVLVCDEATANVDVGTDALIQAAIKAGFGDATVLAIAHRLETIIDSDRVIVLDAGKIVECDKPATLLSDPNGQFTSMVANTGETMARRLHAIAHGLPEAEVTIPAPQPLLRSRSGTLRRASIARSASGLTVVNDGAMLFFFCECRGGL